jgi:succinate-semialdehyde dehydrogenase/glutarate-semialdehyde dehydrogenase
MGVGGLRKSKIYGCDRSATEETFARVPCATSNEVDRALQAAQRAFPKWGRLSPEQRGVLLWRASSILDGRKENIGRLMTREQGKPLKEAVGEIEKAVEMLRFFAEEGKRAYGTIVANTDPSDQSFIVKPVGVVVALSPGTTRWN